MKDGDYMRRRLLVCVTFGTLGLLAAFPISDRLGVDLPLAFGGSAVAGLVVGYVASMLCDVFFGNVGEPLGETEQQSQ
jgi:hypothetical protein